MLGSVQEEDDDDAAFVDNLDDLNNLYNLDDLDDHNCEKGESESRGGNQLGASRLRFDASGSPLLPY